MTDLATKDLTKHLAKIGSIALIGIVILSLSVVATLLIQRVSIFAIAGDSMEPTFENRDSVILKQSKTVNNGDIVFFNKPGSWDEYVDHDTVLVKRITAVPNDKISFDGKQFKVNDETVYKLSENNYECENGQVGYEHVLTNKEIFVMGDNPNHSLDSRRMFCDGEPDKMYIPKHSIVDYGKVVFKF